MRIWKFSVVALGTLSLALPAASPAAAAPRKAAAAYGHPAGHAQANVNRHAPAQARPAPNRQGGAQQVNRNTRQKGGSNVVAGNTVVVNGGAGRGYYDNGNYHGRPDWDDDDDDFLEFVGKTAAVTAGASVVAAVIGSVVNEKPSGCQPVNANGTTYQYCNGTYYQQVSNGYQVVPPPPPQ